MLKKYKKGLRTQISKNFWSTEFDCSCKYPECQWTLISSDHIKNLQELRDRIGPLDINSAYRCDKHNKAVGGTTNSRHKEGDATDIVSKKLTPDQVATAAENFDGLGRYSTFTHIDSRGTKARWDFRKK